MTDVIDQAQYHSELILAREINCAKAKRTGESAYYCTDCGEPIDAQRRALVAGCRRCADCQAAYEYTHRHMTRSERR